MQQILRGTYMMRKYNCFCKIIEKKPVSVELIKNLLGGPNMDYPCMEVADSIECYQVLRVQLIKKLQESKDAILFFEDRMTTNSHIIICIIKKFVRSKHHPLMFLFFFFK